MREINKYDLIKEIDAIKEASLESIFDLKMGVFKQLTILPNLALYAKLCI